MCVALKSLTRRGLGPRCLSVSSRQGCTFRNMRGAERSALSFSLLSSALRMSRCFISVSSSERSSASEGLAFFALSFWYFDLSFLACYSYAFSSSFTGYTFAFRFWVCICRLICCSCFASSFWAPSLKGWPSPSHSFGCSGRRCFAARRFL